MGSTHFKGLKVGDDPATAVEMGPLYEGSATWDAAGILDGNEEATTITVTGAALGDYVIGCSLSIDVADLVLNAQVTAANTVTAILANNTGGTIDLDSATVRALVWARTVTAD